MVTEMSMKIKLPHFKSKSYERYRLELEAWREITELGKSKQGIAIALSLPEVSECNIRENVFDELSIKDLKSEDGFDKLLFFLDSKLNKEDIADSWEKFEIFEDYRRGKGQSITNYIWEFHQRYNKIKKVGMMLPSETLAFKLLRSAGLSKKEHDLVISDINYTNKENLYEEAKRSLIKFKGSKANGSTNNKICDINLSASYLAENQDILLAAGYIHRSNIGYINKYDKKSWNRAPSAEGNSSDYGDEMNPEDSDRKIITCISCGSYYHLMDECPHRWENISEFNVTREENATEGTKDEIVTFGKDCVVVECACSSTVCGEKWLQSYIHSLSDENKEKININPGVKTIKFGSGETLPSIAAYDIPVYIAEKQVIIHTEVVEADIPLLLSLQAMKTATIKLDSDGTVGKMAIMLNHTI